LGSREGFDPVHVYGPKRMLRTAVVCDLRDARADRGIAARGRLRPPYRGRIRVPIRDTAVRPIGPIERITRIAIRARWWANVSPHASTSSTMSNLPAISVSTSLPLRHPSKVRGRRRGNHRKAQGCACQQTGNELLHCNPRYGESEERTLHVGALTSMAA
jgi:hypothetical protein